MNSTVICHCVTSGEMGYADPDCTTCNGSGEVAVPHTDPMICTSCHMPWFYNMEATEEQKDNLCPGCGAESRMLQ